MSNKSSFNVAEARQTMLDTLTPVSGWEVVTLRAGLDRVLYREVSAPFDVPAHDNSAMDGYAVRLADLSASTASKLNIVGTAFAGNAFSGLVGAGQAVRTMTGAVLPHGADVIVAQENVLVDGDAVVVPAGQKAGQHIRRAGEDLARGKPALAAGLRLGPAEIGLLASLGISEVTVRRRLRVAFFSTGDEVASIGRPLAPGEIYDSNRYTLYGALTRLGVELIDLGVVRDDPVALEQTLSEAAAQADVILTSGGVSVGDADYVKEITGRLGDIKFWKLNIKPGRPMAFGRIGEAWLFGLPGNPVAVMVTFYQVVLAALEKMMGLSPLPERPLFKVPCVSSIAKSHGRREFPRGVLFLEHGAWKVRLAGNQGSGVLSSMSAANCFIVLPETSASIQPGDSVEVQPFAALI
ncbi:MAG: molybdopterin molybdenumtransferase MoeA [Proteobacteria bacterium]|nr:molybdopterin molybdenumtransferase MoeA [Pseudomonadota bacterium]